MLIEQRATMVCTVTISVQERVEGPPRVAEAIQGIVRVEVTEPVSSVRLEIELASELRTGPKAVGTQQASSDLYRGDWKPGRYEYPFELECSDPPTYVSEDLSLMRYLRASARAPKDWAAEGYREIEIGERANLEGCSIDVLPAPVDEIAAAHAAERAKRIARTVGALLTFGGIPMAAPVLLPWFSLGELLGVTIPCSYLLLFGVPPLVGSWVRGLAASWSTWGKLTGAPPKPTSPGGYRDSRKAAHELHCQIGTRDGVMQVVATLIVTACARAHAQELFRTSAVKLEPDDAGTSWSGPITLPDQPPLFSFVETIWHQDRELLVGVLWELSLRIDVRGLGRTVTETRMLEFVSLDRTDRGHSRGTGTST
jgi:hypothetical protein